MKLIRVASIALLALFGMSAQAEVHQHGQMAPAATLQLNKGQKWTTDEALRQGMSRLSAAFATVDTNKLTERAHVWLAQKVRVETAYIVHNCKLEPQADAVLHLVLADLQAGADILDGKLPGQKPSDGVAKVKQALKNYAAYFNHPGWK